MELITSRLSLQPLSQRRMADALRTGDPCVCLGLPADKLTWEQKQMYRRVYMAKLQIGLRAPDAWLLCTSWQMVCRRTGELVGEAGFKGPPKWGELEIGYSTRAAHRNRGYMTEAVQALCRYAFQQTVRRVEYVVATTRPDNAPSHRVLIKNGFRRAGERNGLFLWKLPGPNAPEVV
ncbi:MAG: GNAT family N-acetyltransferase [Oscillospiraceae bacterium]|nr:GNAT family N-acetyltransferase [Oscillospiraceae bacterium]